MNKRLLALSALLAVAGSATAMQTNQQGLVTNYNGPIKSVKSDYQNNKVVGITVTLPDGSVKRLDPSIKWDVTNNYLKRVSPVITPAAPARAATPAPAARTSIFKPAAAPVAAAAAALKPAAPVAPTITPAPAAAVVKPAPAVTPAPKPATVTFAPSVSKPAAPVVKPAAEIRATIVPAPAAKPAAAVVSPDVSDTESELSELSSSESEDEVINLPTYRATVLNVPQRPAPVSPVVINQEEPEITLTFKSSQPAAPAPVAQAEPVQTAAPVRQPNLYEWVTSYFMAPRQNAPEETTSTPAPAAATRTAAEEADALIAEAASNAEARLVTEMTPEQRAAYEKELAELLGENE